MTTCRPSRTSREASTATSVDRPTPPLYEKNDATRGVSARAGQGGVACWSESHSSFASRRWVPAQRGGGQSSGGL